jgi:hypothetical protein
MFSRQAGNHFLNSGTDAAITSRVSSGTNPERLMLKQFARWSLVLVLLVSVAWAVAAPAASPRAGEPPTTGPATRTSDWAQFKGKTIPVKLAGRVSFTGSLVEALPLDGDTFLRLRVSDQFSKTNVLVNTRQIESVEGLP